MTAELAQIAQTVRRLDALIGWADTQLTDEHTDRQRLIEDLCHELTDLADRLRGLL